MSETGKKKIAVIGAGPAGLTAAYELLSRSDEYEVTVFEESDMMGGISRTVVHNGNRMDMGGHRFFSKVERVNEWWEKMLPLQGAPSRDDIILNRKCSLTEGGPDPEKTDKVMLKRNRISRIFFKSRFFDYPISLRFETIKNMGFVTTVLAGFSYVGSILHKRKENSLEDFYINRFGKKLYSMFFENYTENLWGRHPSEISPEWGAQRVKGLSILAILKDIFGKIFKKKNRKVETSLIEEFKYPKLGPGELWELTAEEIKKMGGSVVTGAKVTGFKASPGADASSSKITGIRYEKGGKAIDEDCDIVISSMPLKDLVAGLPDVPEECAAIAAGLPYRDYMTVGVLLSKLHLENKTKVATLGDIIPDNWVYVHDKNVRMGRFQVYNNWSPYMVKDPEHTIWMGLEYFCNEGDEFWNMSDKEFAKKAFKEMHVMGLVKHKDEILDWHVERVKKAYPAYFDTYEKIDILRNHLDTIENLYCVGRNGQHRYNNIDHSMCTAFETVDNIISGKTDRSNIWNVNTESEYHEEGES